MALTVNETNSVSAQGFDKSLTQVCFESSPFFTRMKQLKKNKVKGGVDLRWTIRYTQLDRADAVEARDQIIFGQKETRTAAVLDWKYYMVDAMISWDEITKNYSKEAIISLIEDKTTELKEDMDERFSTDLWTANPNGHGISPMPTIVDTGDAYAGIAVADADSNWQSGFEDNATTELVLYGDQSISEAMNAATFGKRSPNFYVTTKDLWSKFESLIEPQIRYQNKAMGDAGFKNVAWHGDPVVSDTHIASGDFYGLCMDVFELWTSPQSNFDVTPWKELFQAGYPKAQAKVLTWAGNLVCKDRKPNFKFTALDFTE